MSKTKVGIAGVGKLGEYHCRTLASMPEAELTGVYDTNAARMNEIAGKYHCRAFGDLQEMLQHVDAVGIVVPTVQHYSVAKAAVQAGVPVFVEKPITSTVAEAEELVDLAAKKNVLLQVGHIERFNPAIRALDGLDVKPMFIESHRLAPFDPRGTDVAVVLDLMIHDIDIILSLVDSEVERIDANGVAVVSDEADIANARLQFRNGCVANVTASRISQRKMRKMRLFQKDSYISIDFLQKLTELFRLVDDEADMPSTIILGQIEKGKKKRHIIYDQPVTPEEDAMEAEWRSFLSCLHSGRKPVVSGEDGLKALTVAAEITRIIDNQKIPE